ncbi:hypothetical protein Tco_1514417 [Tanacetum coccineum]
MLTKIELTLEQSQQGVSKSLGKALKGLKNEKKSMDKKSYALSWKPCQGDSLNLPDHRAQDDQESQIKMIQVKEMMQDNDLKNSKSKDKGSRSRSQSKLLQEADESLAKHKALEWEIKRLLRAVASQDIMSVV